MLRISYLLCLLTLMRWTNWYRTRQYELSRASKWSICVPLCIIWNGPCRKKTCLGDFRQSETQKSVSSATETSYKIEITFETSLYMVLSKQRIIKALISLRGCAGWSAALLLANPRRQVLSRWGPNNAYYFSMKRFLVVKVHNRSFS